MQFDCNLLQEYNILKLINILISLNFIFRIILKEWIVNTSNVETNIVRLCFDEKSA